MGSLLRMERYVQSLPRALDSYGGYTQKAVLIQQWIETFPEIGKVAHLLPPALAALVRNPPPVSAWIPEAHGTAIMLVAGDAAKLDEEAFVEAMHGMNVRMLSGRLYSMIMKMATPKTILRFADTRWETFHRGVKLRTDIAPGNGCTFSMIYPTNLFPELLVKAYSGVFRAVLEASGGQQVRFTVSSFSSTMASLDGTWQG